MDGRTGFLITLALSLVAGACGVDPRWGERRPTNQSFPGSPGVDSRWGEARNGLHKNLEWQYEGLSGDDPEAPE